LNPIAKDFGISEGSLHGWMKKAEVKEGNRPGVTAREAVELRAKKLMRLPEQEVLRRAALQAVAETGAFRAEFLRACASEVFSGCSWSSPIIIGGW